MTPAKPAPASAAIDGWRSAKFGMTLDQVRTAAAADLGVAPEAIQERVIPAEGTTALVVALARLDPGPIPLAVSYLFGARDKRLIQVTILWEHPDPNPSERAALVAAGQRLVRYFAEHPRFAVTLPTGAVDETLIALLRGRDAKGRSIELTLRGASFDRIVNGKRVPAPPVAGPAALRLAYTLDPEHPDILSATTAQQDTRATGRR